MNGTAETVSWILKYPKKRILFSHLFLAWNAGWDENRKIQYLEAHPGERERLLNEDRALRDRYFQLHNDEAGEYYGRHPEFRNEWHGGPVGGDGWGFF